MRKLDQLDGFDRIEISRTSELVCEQIRRVIDSGDLKPGNRLPDESRLAKLLAVGRGAVREAIRALEIAGLVEVRRGQAGGAYITASQTTAISRAFTDMTLLGTANMPQLEEARGRLVRVILGLASENGTEDDFDRLQGCLDRANETLILGHADAGPSSAARHASDFVESLMAASKNGVLVAVVDALSKALPHAAWTSTALQSNDVERFRRVLRDVRARRPARAFARLQQLLTARKSPA